MAKEYKRQRQEFRWNKCLINIGINGLYEAEEDGETVPTLRLPPKSKSSYLWYIPCSARDPLNVTPGDLLFNDTWMLVTSDATYDYDYD